MKPPYVKCTKDELNALVNRAIDVVKNAPVGDDVYVHLDEWFRTEPLLQDRTYLDLLSFFDEVIKEVQRIRGTLPNPNQEIPMNTFPFFRGVLVKGQHFLDPAGKQQAQALTPGDTLELKHEPTNQHDPYAVGVFKDGIRVGYVQKEVSAALAWLLAIRMPLTVTVIEIGKAQNLVINVLEHKP